MGKRALLLFLMAFIPLPFLVFGGRRRRTFPRTALKCYIVAIPSQIARKILQVGVQRLKVDTKSGGKKFTAAIFLPVIGGWSDQPLVSKR